jgi:hypothetical protein
MVVKGRPGVRRDVRAVFPPLHYRRLKGVALSAVAEVDPHLLIYAAPEAILIDDMRAPDGVHLVTVLLTTDGVVAYGSAVVSIAADPSDDLFRAIRIRVAFLGRVENYRRAPDGVFRPL